MIKLFRKNISEKPDEELMRELQSGKSNSFDELYKRYSSKMIYYFYKAFNGDEEKARDFAQDLFLKIITKPESFNTEKKFSTWIYAVAYNKCKDEYKSAQIRKTEQLDLYEFADEDMSKVEFRIDFSKFNAKLNDELDKLSAEHKTVFLLRYKEEFSIKEIAETLNCPEGTVKSRLYYTLNKIATKLIEYNPKFEGVKDGK